MQEQSHQLTFDMPEGVMSLEELRMKGYFFYMEGIREANLISYKAVYLKSGILGGLGDNVGYRDTDMKVCTPVFSALTL